MFDAFVRRQQSERQPHVLALNSKLILADVGIRKRRVRDAMHDEVDFVFGNVVFRAKHVAAAFGHDNQSSRKLGQLVHGAPLSGIGCGQNRVQRGHDRNPQVSQKCENVAPAKTAVDAELMLQ